MAALLPGAERTRPGRAGVTTVGGFPLADPSTHTVYTVTGSALSVIDSSLCNATDRRGCARSWPTFDIAAGFAALDRQTHTLYFVNLSGPGNTLSLIDASKCNATDTAGCGAVLASVTVGSGPGVPAVDEGTDTIYVPNGNDGTVSVIDGTSCNATDTSGCGKTPATVAAGPGAGAIGIDSRTHTVYVANFNDGTVSVINGATCDAIDTTGCALAPATVAVGPGPVSVVVDQASDTVYVPTFGPSLGAVSMIDLATCNATDTSSCGQTPPTTPIGSAPNGATENPVTHTLYVTNQEDSTVSAIDMATCNAITTSGCRTPAPAMAMGFNAGGVDVDPTTDTVYATSQNNGTISVLNGAKCNATDTSGCTRFAPTTAVGNGPQAIAVDAASGTVYVGNQEDNTVSVIGAAACNITHLSGCGRSWPTVGIEAGPFFGLAVDQRTSTLYAANYFDIQTRQIDNTVSVIDAGACNAHDSSGCAQSPPTTTVGNCPAGETVDPATHTLYVANGCDNTVSVIDTSACNAHQSSGCGQAWPSIAVGNGPVEMALNPATDTLYVANNGDSTVSVVNAATCNAEVTSGCGQAPPAVQVQDSPYSIAVDEHTNTVYVANTGNEIFQSGIANVTSSVSMLDGVTCNAHDSAGCNRVPSAFDVGGFPFGIATDQNSDHVYVSSIVDSDLAAVDAAACNARTTTGCHPQLLQATTGGWPNYIGLDPAVGTMYVPDNVDGAVSLFRLP